MKWYMTDDTIGVSTDKDELPFFGTYREQAKRKPWEEVKAECEQTVFMCEEDVISPDYDAIRNFFGSTPVIHITEEEAKQKWEQWANEDESDGMV